MYPALHTILMFTYTVLPVWALIWSIRRSAKSHSAGPVISFIITCFSAVILGTSIVILSAVILQGRVLIGPILQNWYFLLGLLCLMGALRWMVREGTYRVFRVSRHPNGRPTHPAGLRATVAFLVQSVLLFIVGLPFVIGTMLVHRTRVHTVETPQMLADCDAEAVIFQAVDGPKIAGWWIPADPVKPILDNDMAGHRTILLCGTIGDDLKHQAGLLRVLVNDGYNVLAVDLRGNGDSDGQWAGFGAVEYQDVLGAVRWLKNQHPQEARLIYGVGGGVGGAALIAAAVDPGSEGQAIDALAVYGVYSDFTELSRSILDDRISVPFRRVALKALLPIVSAHAGVDLSQFAPAKLVDRLWPRPILIAHGRADSAVPFSEGMDLFRAATFPKRAMWLPGNHTGIYLDRRGAGILLQFLDTARTFPAI